MGQAAREDVAQGMEDILNEMAIRAEFFLKDLWPDRNWCSILEKNG